MQQGQPYRGIIKAPRAFIEWNKMQYYGYPDVET
jgi:hypothetical protein